MAANKSLISWIIMAILIVVGLAVGWSIWSSLQDARAKLEAQKEKMAELQKDKENLEALRDSLHQENNKLVAREQALRQKYEDLTEELRLLEIKHKKALARIDTLWEPEAIISELDQAFPQWAGLFWRAKTPNGLEGMIAPRFFSNHVLEIVEDFNNGREKLENCDKRIANRDSLLTVKDQRIENLQTEVTALDTTYKKLFGEYEALNDKYNKEVKSHWFKFSLGNAVYTGVGFGAGFLVGNATK